MQINGTDEYMLPADSWYGDDYIAWQCAIEGAECTCDGKVIYAPVQEGLTVS
jgi:hypothetical protein